MKPATRYRHLVDDRTRAAGESYLSLGRVSRFSITGGNVQAVVAGTHDYHVHLLPLDVPASTCTCPYFQKWGVFCKHLWAVLLLASQRHASLFDPARMGGSAQRGAPGKASDWRDRLLALRHAAADLRLRLPEPVKPYEGEVLYLVMPLHPESSEGGLRVAVKSSKPDRKGKGAVEKLRRPDALDFYRLGSSQDRQIMTMLMALDDSPDGMYFLRPETFSIPLESWQDVLPLMCATGRAFLQLDPNNAATREPLRWDGGGAWELIVQGRREESQRQYVLEGSLHRGDERMELSELKLGLEGGLIFSRGQVAPLNDNGAFSWLMTFKQRGAIRVPESQCDEMLEELLRMPALPRLELPEELHVREVELAPTPVLRVRASRKEETYNTRLRAQVWFDYGCASVSSEARELTVYDRTQRRLIRRDLVAEGALENRLEFLNPQVVSDYATGAKHLLLTAKRLPLAVRTLTPEGWRVEADGKLYRPAKRLDICVSSGVDWFDLNGKAEFDGGSVGLPRLLEAMRKGEEVVQLDDGSFGMMPEDWLKRYRVLMGAGQADGQTVRFRRHQAGLLDVLLESQEGASGDEVFERTRRQLRDFDGIAPADAPPSFQGELRTYQRAALGWFEFLRRFGFGGCLADDMGLGKTVQVLALLAGRSDGRSEGVPSLIVVPRSLVFNWKQEAARFAPHLRILDHSLADRARQPEAMKGYDLVLTTYGTLRRDAAFLKDVEFDYVVLDEAQAIKNPQSESAKAARLLRGRHRLALSGTPIQNHLGDLWSLMEFLNPGMLGSAKVFAGAAGREPDEQTRRMLSRAMRPFILRRTKEQVAADLPDRVEQTLYCELDETQRKLYDELRDHYRRSLLPQVEAQGLGRAKIQILEALLRLRQAALHPGLIDKARSKEMSAKLDLLLPQLSEVLEEGHKALVFSQFTGMLAILRHQLDGLGIPYEYLDGKTTDRQARVERFQGDNGKKLFLISLKAGGLGLNLTAADYVFLLDPWWNPAVEAQAIDRAHRIGQTKRVFACRIIAKDTVEEKVLALQESKRELADAIVGADASLIRSLGRDDLELLLS